MPKIRSVAYGGHVFLPPALTRGAMPGHLTAVVADDSTPQAPSPSSLPSPFEVSVASLVGAETGGFDGVLCADATQAHMPTAAWTTEFSDLMADGPDPNAAFTMEPVIAAAAAQTRDIEFIWGPVDVVRRAPINIAQMLLTLDHATRGRVAIILAQGQQNHMRQTGIPRAGTADKLWDGIQIIKKLTTQAEPFSYRGRVWKFDHGALALPPYGPTPPAVLIAGGAPESLELAGRFADGWLDCPPGLDDDDPEVFRFKISEIRRHARAAGRDPDTLRIMVQCPVVLADDKAVVEELLDHPYVRWATLIGATSATYRKWGLAHPYGGENYNYFKDVIPEWVSRSEFIDVTARIPREAVSRTHFVGTAEQVVERLEPYLACGITDFMTFNPAMLAGSRYLASCAAGGAHLTKLLASRDVSTNGL